MRKDTTNVPPNLPAHLIPGLHRDRSPVGRGGGHDRVLRVHQQDRGRVAPALPRVARLRQLTLLHHLEDEPQGPSGQGD